MEQEFLKHRQEVNFRLDKIEERQRVFSNYSIALLTILTLLFSVVFVQISNNIDQSKEVNNRLDLLLHEVVKLGQEQDKTENLLLTEIKAIYKMKDKDNE